MTVAQAIASARAPDAAKILAHDDELLADEERQRFEALCARRACGEPYAYLVGAGGFYGREFLVSPAVLVPRPETEHLVDDAIAFLRDVHVARVLDVGTGSGAIACTIAAELSVVRVDAVDISSEALCVARANAQRLGVAKRVTCFQSDLLAALRADDCYDVIVANLPYVPTGDIAAAPDPVSFEPRIALDGGADGLDVYRRFLAEVGSHMMPRGRLLLEAAPPLMAPLRRAVAHYFANATISVQRDYASQERYVRIELD